MSRILLLLPDGTERSIEAREGANLLHALREQGVFVPAPCGGHGRCGNCRVTLLERDGEREVLACRTSVCEGMKLLLPEAALGCESATVTVPGRHRRLCAAVDLGTTTVAVRLLERESGEVLGTNSAWNAQEPYGADVISRCDAIRADEGGLRTLSTLIRAQIEDLLEELCRRCGVSADDVGELLVAGNTVMEHIVAGLSPLSIAAAPFTPLTLFGEKKSLRLAGRRVYCAPCVAGYVGGDTVAGLYAAQRAGKFEGKTVLYLDIGTNGELVLAANGAFLCCAVSCGPAFEGANIRCGMTATSGAVSRVQAVGDELELEVIGGGGAKGLCGSGLLDLIAALLRRGLIDGSGRLLTPAEAGTDWGGRLREDEHGNGCFSLAADSPVFLTAEDVRAVQLAKAALAAGIDVLLKEAHLRAEDIDRVLIAGGFGRTLNIQNAAALGLLPACLAEKCEAVGNAALEGAAAALTERDGYEKLMEIQRRCRYLELSASAAFQTAFVDELLFEEDET